jgi:hypothetical protein
MIFVSKIELSKREYDYILIHNNFHSLSFLNFKQIICKIFSQPSPLQFESKNYKDPKSLELGLRSYKAQPQSTLNLPLSGSVYLFM